MRKISRTEVRRKWQVGFSQACICRRRRQNRQHVFTTQASIGFLWDRTSMTAKPCIILSAFADEAATIRSATALDAKLIRGFSFYHPKGEDPAKHVQLAADRLGPIVDLCAKAGLVYGLEVEANLVGQNGRMLAALAKAVGRSNM